MSEPHTPERRDLRPRVAVALALSLTVCFFGPLTSFFRNYASIGLTHLEGVSAAGLDTLLAFVVLTALLLPWRESAARSLLAPLVVLTAWLWIAGSIDWGFGPIDGREIDWSSYLPQAVVELVVLAAALVASVRYSKPLLRRWPVLLGLITFAQAGTTVLAFQQAPPVKVPALVWDEATMFEMGRTDNVVVVIIDNFGNQLFELVLDEEPELAKGLRDFTYFRNNVGGYPTTKAALPLLLHGTYYPPDSQEPFSEFTRRRYLAGSLPLNLKQAGYRSDLVTSEGQLIIPELADNLKPRSFGHALRSFRSRCLLLSLFRQAPLVQKPGLHQRLLESSFIHSEYNGDLSFHYMARKDLRVGAAEKVFKLYHLRGTHPPFILNRNLELGHPPTFVSAPPVEQGIASLKITLGLLDGLRRLGLYDRSFIAIVADHGNDLGRFRLPTVLLKRPGDQHPAMVLNMAPAMSADFAHTVLSELGVPHSVPGTDLFRLDPAAPRRRISYFYQWDGDWARDRLPPLTERVDTEVFPIAEPRPE